MGEVKKTASVLLTVMETAGLIGVSVESVRYYERTGKLTAMRLHTGQRLFLPMVVERFITERRAKQRRAGAKKAAS